MKVWIKGNFQVLNFLFLCVQRDESLDKRYAIRNSGISCLAVIFNLNRMTIQHTENWFKVAQYDESYIFFPNRLIQTHGIVVKENCSELGNTCSIPAGC